MKIKAYKVSKITDYMRDLLEDDMLLCGLWVEGEVSGFTRHSSGHLFFALKDEESTLRCVIFKGEASELPNLPKNGDLVRIYGRISLYKKSGEVRLIGEFLDLAGEGNILQSLDKLKEKLLAEGVFANRRKIPTYARKIAIVTSLTGAAIADMLKIIRSRNHLTEVVILPTLVQGDHAPADIVQALEIANAQSGADVLIVGRGGGSAEDLWAFNNEMVARAVFASAIPVISAVGHETDFSLCDFAADLRCATPTEAAEVATPRWGQMVGELKFAVDELNQALNSQIEEMPARLKRRAGVLRSAVHRHVDSAKRDLLSKSEILEKISPMAVLRRGFAFVTDNEGNTIRKSSSLTAGQSVALQFQDGETRAEIKG
ncbi:MAG: exodeoxyribonuclease VII large subunit [Defluviitaleaceae bacterium]|nr:exodeoxyribonuclease VII large subunit [Defluviitaleaceae bacterium]